MVQGTIVFSVSSQDPVYNNANVLTMPVVIVRNQGVVALASATGVVVAPPMMPGSTSTAVLLNGQQSYDPEGGKLEYLWTYLQSRTTVQSCSPLVGAAGVCI